MHPLIIIDKKHTSPFTQKIIDHAIDTDQTQTIISTAVDIVI